jgi:pimeloyl-ACP methyl ester carboxylesterase
LSAAETRRQLLALLGDLPPRGGEPTGRLIETASDGGREVERWSLDLNGREPVPALLALPRDVALRGVVLYCHAHGNRFDIGKDELLTGRPALATPPYGAVLPELGFAALAIDHWGFGERATASERVLNKRFLWEGSTLWGMRIADTLAAFDWVRARLPRPPVIALGLSMGSTMAWWTAALEPGIAGCVDLCCLAEFDALRATGADDLHGEYYFIPGLRKHFTAAAINACIVPRPHLSCAGAEDPLTPPAGLRAVDEAMRIAYADAGNADAWQQRVFQSGHLETPEMREAVLAFLDRWFGGESGIG